MAHEGLIILDVGSFHLQVLPISQRENTDMMIKYLFIEEIQKHRFSHFHFLSKKRTLYWKKGEERKKKTWGSWCNQCSQCDAMDDKTTHAHTRGFGIKNNRTFQMTQHSAKQRKQSIRQIERCSNSQILCVWFATVNALHLSSRIMPALYATLFIRTLSSRKWKRWVRYASNQVLLHWRQMKQQTNKRTETLKNIHEQINKRCRDH